VSSAWSEVGLTRTNFGSYTLNTWVTLRVSAASGGLHPQVFHTAADVDQPSSVPLLSDGTGRVCFPTAADFPPRNLNGPEAIDSSMRAYCIPRHGSFSGPVPTDHPPEQAMPGGINMTFDDGHAEFVRLERLWKLSWHKGYIAPEKRPGLR
jgi:hypothetical protein